MNAQKGFTLIELVVVIVILGILAATALPRFVDMSKEAGDAAAQGTSAAISSAASLNYAKFKAAGGTSTGAISISGTGSTPSAGAANCSTLTGLLAGSALPASISWVNPNATINCSTGVDISSCQLKHSQGTATGVSATMVTCTN